MTVRCRICTANDRAALVQELAETMWNTHRDREIDLDWAEAGPYWRQTILQFVDATIKVLHRDG